MVQWKAPSQRNPDEIETRNRQKGNVGAAVWEEGWTESQCCVRGDILDPGNEGSGRVNMEGWRGRCTAGARLSLLGGKGQGQQSRGKQEAGMAGACTGPAGPAGGCCCGLRRWSCRACSRSRPMQLGSARLGMIRCPAAAANGRRSSVGRPRFEA